MGWSTRNNPHNIAILTIHQNISSSCTLKQNLIMQAPRPFSHEDIWLEGQWASTNQVHCLNSTEKGNSNFQAVKEVWMSGVNGECRTCYEGHFHWDQCIGKGDVCNLLNSKKTLNQGCDWGMKRCGQKCVDRHTPCKGQLFEFHIYNAQCPIWHINMTKFC